jgi:hypothetical protein
MSQENLARIMQQEQFDPSLQQKLAAQEEQVHKEEEGERELEDGELETVAGGNWDIQSLMRSHQNHMVALQAVDQAIRRR